MIVKYNDSHFGGWQEGIAQTGELYHDIRWRQIIKETYGLKPEYYLNINNGNILGGLPAFKVRNKLISLPYLPFCGSWGEFPKIDELVDETNSAIFTKNFTKNISELGIDDYITMRLDIPETEKELWKLIGPKTRNLVRKAKRHSFELVSATIDNFYSVYCAATNALGTPPHKKKLFVLLDELFNGMIYMKVVHLEGRIVSCILEVDYNEIRYDLWAFSLKEYFPLSPNMFLYFQVLVDAIESGIKTYDFGRSQYRKGTYYFKKQWGAEPWKTRILTIYENWCSLDFSR